MKIYSFLWNGVAVCPILFLGGVVMKDFYSPKEVSQILNIHEKTVRRYLRDGVLKGQKLGGNWKVSKEVLVSYMDDAPVSGFRNDFEVVESGGVRMSLKVEVDVDKAKSAHKLAKKLMEVIDEQVDQNCDFQYRYEDGTAKLLLSGEADFLIQAMHVLKTNGK